ncbi:MAG TPA: hypothetical protein VGQ23_19190 [Burkholderiaceae bacterium]|nr:hypothetical protein [Burkholderiaceae bacterium]
MAQTMLDFADTEAPLEGDGFAIGWAHAQHGIVPPVEHLASASPVRHGWQAGRAAFARRTLPVTPAARQWLQLRLQAWRQGLAFEAVQVTPHYLKQLAATHCPITRDALLDGEGVVERVRRDAGIAAGNLAVLAERVAAARDGGAALDERQAQRLAVLESFVTPLPHAHACALPLVVLPPNRLRLFNPVQALQALVTRLLVGEGFAQRASRLEALLPGDTAQRAFRRFVHALLPRVLTAGKGSEAQALRWALEDAWHDTLVMARWHRFALLLTPEQCERVVQRAAARGIAPVRLLATPEPLATEGWALDDFGLARPPQEHRPARQRPLPPRSAPAAEQVALPL